MSADAFVPGIELSRQLASVLEPGLRRLVADLPFALALLGPGSDVLGFDTARSMDHDWGPRLTVVVPDARVEEASALIESRLPEVLPAQIGGFPTRFSTHADGTLFADSEGTRHRINVTSIARLLQENLNIASLGELDAAAWLSTPMQHLLELTAGDVFVDDSGELSDLRTRLAFFPDAVRRYQLSALWMRIGQIQPFIGRTGELDDDTGSVLIAASIARDMMRIGLLQSGLYAPYAKWLGTALARTVIGGQIGPHLQEAAHVRNWHERELGINAAGIALIDHLNTLGLTDPISAKPSQFHTRPFLVLPGEDIAHALHASLADTALAGLPPFVGGIDVITDSTDALKHPAFRQACRRLYAGTQSQNATSRSVPGELHL